MIFFMTKRDTCEHNQYMSGQNSKHKKIHPILLGRKLFEVDNFLKKPKIKKYTFYHAYRNKCNQLNTTN